MAAPAKPAPPEAAAPDAAVLAALPIAVVRLDAACRIVAVNPAAEQVLGGGSEYLAGRALEDLVPDDSQLVALVRQVAREGVTVVEYGVELAGVRLVRQLVDVRVAPLADPAAGIVVCLEPRPIARLLDDQRTHLGAARSVAGMAALLAHEVKNPLSGIRGAAQLLEQSLDGPERELTTLIREETDRIRDLVERVDLFSDDRPLARDRVNIHSVLDHVLKLVTTGLDTRVRILQHYDPSLPAVHGNRDQLIQVFLNLLKNAIEAAPELNGEIMLTTRYQHGFRMTSAGSRTRQDLPIVVAVRDNGPGVPDELRDCLFDPFVTSKRTGTGLGLSLVAKIVADHGGMVEFDSERRMTEFRVRLPAAPAELAAGRPYPAGVAAHRHG